MDPWIWGVGAVTAAGATVENFWSALCHGQSCFENGVGRIVERQGSSAATLAAWVQTAIEQVGPLPEERRGLIFCSTKGALEDWIWSTEESRDPVFEVFQLISKGEWDDAVSISSACASGLVGLDMAMRWLRSGRVDGVMLVTCDEVGRFVESGFSSLKALSTSSLRPFSADRDGLRLGEAAVALYLSKQKRNHLGECGIRVAGVATETEGFAATRPAESGESVVRVATRSLGGKRPDLIIAHGTGTRVNDQLEDLVFSRVAPEVPVTCTKWAVGHTLASSASLDLVAAVQALKNQKTFAIASTPVTDPAFRARYITGAALEIPLRRVLLTSLGFGGVHAAASLELA